MSVPSPKRPRSDEAQHATLREELRAAGLRATPARIAVLAMLRDADGPQSHAEVVEAAAGRGGDPATVFRNLAALTEAGFARRTDLGDRVWRFEATGSPLDATSSHEHPHFLCTNCGHVECMPQLEVQTRGRVAVPKAVRDHAVEIQLKGLCDECSAVQVDGLS